MAKGLVTRSVTAMGGTVTERAGFRTDDGDLVLDVGASTSVTRRSWNSGWTRCRAWSSAASSPAGRPT